MLRIAELLGGAKGFLSLEFFPPKEEASWPAFFEDAGKLKAVNPLFTSVTYGAGGGTQSKTLDIVARMKKDYGFEPMAHLTCVGASEERLRGFLDRLVENGIDNVLALRGDPPQGAAGFVPEGDGFKYAYDLVAFIKDNYPGLGVGVAAYPETHPEASSPEEDLRHLKEKLDRGGDFAITQLFFDNSLYWSFMEKARTAGIDKPIIPGVMPIFNLKIIKRITSLCGASIPESLLDTLEKAQERGGDAAVMDAGIEHATAQIQDLLDGGARGVHLYTLNKAEACLRLYSKIKFGRA